MRLALIGPRGSGKTTAALILAERLNAPAVSTDRLVEEKLGGGIEEFVRAKGWSAFRDAEKLVLAEIMGRCAREMILDCGGGIILHPANREHLARIEMIVYLCAEPEVLVKRLESDSVFRPPLTDEESPLEEIRHVLARRDFLYRSLAHLVLDTTQLSPEEVAQQILQAVSAERNAKKQ